eukprot:c34103_g1_i1.p2 GENE.c34103_g1_i1~~c34103_g1_i1.p2  ORF type:complete len:157 (+),score=35.97 c34103_g1_i1:109-579(+)
MAAATTENNDAAAVAAIGAAPVAPEAGAAVTEDVPASSVFNIPIAKMTSDMFGAMGAYLEGQLVAHTEEYRLLEAMNTVTADKYAHMTGVTRDLAGKVAELQNQYLTLLPFMAQIDEIHDQVQRLEEAVIKLDDYTKRLAAAFQSKEAKLAKLSRK